MSAEATQAERRAIPRFDLSAIDATLRIPGKLGSSSGRLIDFNRYGVAVCLAGSCALITPRTKLVTISFTAGRYQVHNALAVVHNRYRSADGDRLGMRFRVDSAAQLDAAALRQTLRELEQALQKQTLEQVVNAPMVPCR